MSKKKSKKVSDFIAAEKTSARLIAAKEGYKKSFPKSNKLLYKDVIEFEKDVIKANNELTEKQATKIIKKLNDYMVLGIKRPEFRGDSKTLKKDHVKAKDSNAAMDKYNDKHREYKAVSLEKLEMD